MIKPCLVVLAAGIGSRYGGVKQMETVDTRGHSIIDYTLYDAVTVGIEEVLFVIRSELKDEFLSLIKRRRWYNMVSTRLVLQDADTLPISAVGGFIRKKPWGTAHAMACLDGIVEKPFVMLNADDFYGREALATTLFDLKKNQRPCATLYKLGRTLSVYGGVNRGVCRISNGFLVDINEKVGIRAKDEGIFDENGTEYGEEDWVSMNLWGFTPYIIKECKVDFEDFVNKIPLEDEKAELGITEVIKRLIAEKKIGVRALFTDSDWTGITYKEDLEGLKSTVSQRVDEGIYPPYL